MRTSQIQQISLVRQRLFDTNFRIEAQIEEKNFKSQSNYLKIVFYSLRTM